MQHLLLDLANDWISSNALKLNNIDKTQFVKFSFENNNNINSAKLLGVNPDRGMNWFTQITELRQTARPVFLLTQLRYAYSCGVLLIAYFGLIEAA